MIFMTCGIASNSFPTFTVGKKAGFIKEFKCLGNVISNTMKDDSDIERDIRCIF